MTDVRAHRAGSLFLRRRDLRWTASVTMPDGSRPTHGCRHLDHRPSEKRPCDEAKALLAELLRLRDAGAVRADPRLTLRDFLDRWLENVRPPTLAPATWRKHESICRVWLIPELGSYRLSDLSVRDVRSFLAGGRTNAQTIRHWRSTLRRALADALRDGLVTRNVAALAEPPKLPQRERPFLTGPQARALIEGTRDDRLGPLFHLAVTTGMREAELLGLAWKDVDLGDADGAPRRTADVSDIHERPTGALVPSGRASRDTVPLWRDSDANVRRGAVHSAPPAVHVNATLHRQDHEWVLAPPKTAKSRRVIPLTAGCAQALREHRRKQLLERVGKPYPAFGLVFTTPAGKPMYDWQVLQPLYAAEERLGLPRVGVHGLRHSAATILYAEGVDIETIADILGHSSSRITSLLYRHRVADLSRDAAERMGKAVS